MHVLYRISNHNHNNNNKLAATHASKNSSTCCSCNGSRAKCVNCLCVKMKRPCINCYPSRSDSCPNNIRHRQLLQHGSSQHGDHHSDGPGTQSTLHAVGDNDSQATPSSSSPPLFSDPTASLSVMDTPLHTSGNGSIVDINSMLVNAYGESLALNSPPDDECYSHWKTVVNLAGKHYTLPGGAVGCQYVDQLSKEVSYLCTGVYSSARLLVSSSVVLQRDCSIRKGLDIRRVIERRLSMWQEGAFDTLVHEAVQCNKCLSNQSLNHTPSHIATVFTKLMLLGKVKAAVRWMSEHSHCNVLKPTDTMDVMNSEGVTQKVSVLSLSSDKHPDPVIPSRSASALVECDDL